MIGPEPPSTPNFFHTRTLQKISGRMALATVVAFFLISCLITAHQQLSGFLSLTDVGYPDSYILYDILHFQNTGVIYRDLSQPPYLPSLYSPMVYILYSIPGKLVTFENPFVGPRILALAAFLLCIAIVVSIARALIPDRSTWWWSLLLAGSIGTISEWALQLRGDLPGVLFNLLAIRLLFSRWRWAALIAGLCAGFSTQFKITYVAALVAGSLWLLAQRRWRDFAAFAVGGACTFLGVYLLIWAREPRMLQQITALSPGVADVPGLFKILYKVLSQPVVLLATLAISPAILRAGSRWVLLILFALASLSIASLTDVQAGGNVNYFAEFLFATVPAAVIGVRRLTAWAGRQVGAGAFVTTLVAFYLLGPLAIFYFNLAPAVSFYSADARNSVASINANNQMFRRVAGSLRGRHIFSTIPRVALLDPQPTLEEPYLLSYLERAGKFDPGPILRRIDTGEYDVVVTRPFPQIYRGISHVEPNLRRAIVAAYRPYCVYSDYLVHLPVNRQNSSNALESSLNGIGCKPLVCNSTSTCIDW